MTLTTLGNLLDAWAIVNGLTCIIIFQPYIIPYINIGRPIHVLDGRPIQFKRMKIASTLNNVLSFSYLIILVTFYHQYDTC